VGKLTDRAYITTENCRAVKVVLSLLVSTAPFKADAVAKANRSGNLHSKHAVRYLLSGYDARDTKRFRFVGGLTDLISFLFRCLVVSFSNRSFTQSRGNGRQCI
jgi:hypothetical protein